jgi:(R,R)-butanediol dehydrogenase/meso-butanediol dehydrogenase/diacetyl reductase
VLAAIYHGPRDVRIEDVADPGPPASGEVRLEVLCASLCGTDVSEYLHGPALVPLNTRHPGSGHVGPTIIGHEFVGSVAEVGPGVEGFAIGQRVASGAGVWCGACQWCRSGRTNLCARYYTLGLSTHGGMAEWVNAPAITCREVPEACSNEHAAMAQPLAVALHAVNRGRVRDGEVVVLIGVGGIGLFMLAALVARGAHVVALDLEEQRLAAARRLGAAAAFDVSEPQLDALKAAACDQRPVDVVVEASGAPPSPALAQRLVRRGGRVVLVGIQSAPREVELADLVLREVDVVATNAHVCGDDLPEALALLATTDLGAFALERVVALRDVLDDGLEALAERRAGGKVVARMPRSGAADLALPPV